MPRSLRDERFDLAFEFAERHSRHDAARGGTVRAAEAEPAIRAVYRTLKAHYSDAAFSDVYFLIGRFTSGGTATGRGLVVGAEMYADPRKLAPLVAHELIHFQQVGGDAGLTLPGMAVRQAAR